MRLAQPVGVTVVILVDALWILRIGDVPELNAAVVAVAAAICRVDGHHVAVDHRDISVAEVVRLDLGQERELLCLRVRVVRQPGALCGLGRRGKHRERDGEGHGERTPDAGTYGAQLDWEGIPEMIGGFVGRRQPAASRGTQGDLLALDGGELCCGDGGRDCAGGRYAPGAWECCVALGVVWPACGGATACLGVW